MGNLKHFFNSKDVAQLLNTLLWGSESWNISNHNCNNLRAFHHSAIWETLGIWMDEVKECHIMNEQVRKCFNNIPLINDFIARRTWAYIGKVLRTKNKSVPKKGRKSQKLSFQTWQYFDHHIILHQVYTVNVFDKMNQNLCNQVTDYNTKYKCSDLPAGLPLQVILTDSNNMEAYKETCVVFQPSDGNQWIPYSGSCIHHNKCAWPYQMCPTLIDEFIFWE